MDRKVMAEIAESVFHYGNSQAFKLHIILYGVAFLVSYFGGFVMQNIDQFLGITAVLVLDSFAGVLVALKNRKFETRKALKFVWYFVGYTSLLSVCLLVEKAFAGAFWLSETVIIPILTFQVISILKNFNRLGVLSGEQLGKLLEKIDSYKDEEN